MGRVLQQNPTMNDASILVQCRLINLVTQSSLIKERIAQVGIDPPSSGGCIQTETPIAINRALTSSPVRSSYPSCHRPFAVKPLMVQ